MKKRILAFLLIVVMFSIMIGSGSMGIGGSVQAATNWVLTWSDEFDGTGAPDSSKWERPSYNRRNNSNGPDGYWDPNEVYLDGAGNCVIRVQKVANRNGDGDPYDYAVGAIRTYGKFTQKYGRFECRAQLPQQQGWWVAFWMMQGNQGSIGNGGVDGSEVDIMEGWGWTDKINHAIHWDGYGANHQSVGKNEIISGIRSGWHTYTLDWMPDVYIFYIDGVEQWRSTGGGICNQPGYIKVTGEISTEAWAITDSWAKNPANATYPDYFKIDYVRVYEYNGTEDGVLFQSGLETSDTQPTWSDTLDGVSNVTAYPGASGPECSIRQEGVHSGSKAIMYSGHDNSATTSYCKYKVFDVNIPVTANTKMSYWIYPQQDMGRYVSIDFVNTDGTTLRDSGAKDYNGFSMHPNQGHGGNIPINTWTQIKCNVGQWLNGKTIDRIIVNYDRPALTGNYRGYIDDILITNGTLP